MSLREREMDPLFVRERSESGPLPEGVTRVTLQELRNKWFLKFGPSDATFPPSQRHTGNTLSNYTDGNKVEALLDGQKYMEVWHDSVGLMHGVAGAELYHAGWRMEGVKTLGESKPTSDALDVIDNADSAGVAVKLMLSRHAGGALSAINMLTVDRLRLRGVWTACVDNRFPPVGSNHQKAICFKNPNAPSALLGSLDISATRWDTDKHNLVNMERHPRWGKQTHDTGVLIKGPAVADVERAFAERWNDSTRRFGLEPVAPPQPLITTPPSTPAPVGTHSVQVLQTYGKTSRFYGYSWSPAGEFSVWAAYMNAIKKARKYIYIEDQYFLPFGYPPLFGSTGTARESDIVWQLGEAIKRGVKVVVLVPNNAEDRTHAYQQHQRDLGVVYLEDLAFTVGGKFVIAFPEVDGSPVYVHSKLMIVDDEFVLLGSANVCQRSMSVDGELTVGVVDGAELFARQLRTALWGEHLERDPATLVDPDAAYSTFEDDAFAKRGRVRIYEPTAWYDPPTGHGPAMRQIVDPYGGPPRGTAVFDAQRLLQLEGLPA